MIRSFTRPTLDLAQPQRVSIIGSMRVLWPGFYTCGADSYCRVVVLLVVADSQCLLLLEQPCLRQTRTRICWAAVAIPITLCAVKSITGRSSKTAAAAAAAAALSASVQDIPASALDYSAEHFFQLRVLSALSSTQRLD